MNNTKEPLHFIKYFIIENKGRFIIGIILSIIFCGLLKSEFKTHPHELIYQYEHNDKKMVHYYDVVWETYETVKYPSKTMGWVDEDNNTFHYFTLTKPQFIFSIIGVFLLIFWAMSLFLEDWDIRKCRIDAGIKHVKTFEEDGTIYYRYKGKLLHTTSYIMNPYEVRDLIGNFYDSSPNMYPDFEMPKRKLRNHRLGEILDEK